MSCAYALENRKARCALWPCGFRAAPAWTYAPTGWLRERQGEGAKRRPQRQKAKAETAQGIPKGALRTCKQVPCALPMARGAGGSAPSTPIWWRGGLTAPKPPHRKSGAGRSGFSSFTSPAKRPPERYRVRLDGGEYSPPEPGLSCCVSSPPPGGDAVGGGGGTFTPYGVPLPIPGQGRGKVGPLSGPIVAQMGYNRRSRRPR